MPTPVLLSKISLQYSADEDRIGLSGETSSAAQVALWLTLRLCQRLVPILVRFVEKALAQPGIFEREQLMSFRQTAAMLNRTATEPVRLPDCAQPVRVDQIDLQQSSSGITLVFKPQSGESAQLTLNLEQSQQVLGILHQQYRVAEWPLNAWPDWMDAPQTHAGSLVTAANLH